MHNVNQKKETIGNYFDYLDYLRIIACLTVMIIHVSGQNLAVVEVASYPWFVFNLINKTTGWSVCVFVMISGALFLDNDRPLRMKHLFTVKISRIVIAYLFWAAIYALEKWFVYKDLQIAMNMFLEGRYHLWYLLMTAGLYAATPVLRKITESKDITEYFLLVTGVCVILLPELEEFLVWLDIPQTVALSNLLKEKGNTIDYAFPALYTFYFILGFYLNKYTLKVNARKWSYMAAIIGCFLIIGFTSYAAVIRKENVSLLFRPCVLAMSAGIFLFARNILNNIHFKAWQKQWLRKLSAYTFGAYLVHALVLSQLRDQLHFTTLSFSPVVSVILLEICVAVLSFGISAILNCCPVLKKYIV